MIALRHLNEQTMQHCMPLIDLAAPGKSGDIKNAIDYAERNLKRMSNCVSGFSTILIDSSELNQNIRLSGGKHPIVEAANVLEAQNVTPIPVTGLHRDINHMKATKFVMVSSNGIVCIRLDATDIGMAQASHQRIRKIVSDVGASSRNVLLLLDMQGVYGLSAEGVTMQVNRFINTIEASEWRGIIVAGYGIPERIAQAVHVRAQGYIPRVERQVFGRVARNRNIPNLWFGDYTTLAPTHVELDWKIIYKTMGPKAIYALGDSWFVVRGGPFFNDRDGRAQYYSLAAQIVALEEFPRNPGYSFGDKYIYDRRQRGGVKPGSPGSWISACVNRHITLTSDLHKVA